MRRPLAPSDRTRLQVRGSDHEWWDIEEISSDGYVQLSRRATEYERFSTDLPSVVRAGVPRDQFKEWAGIDSLEDA